MVPLQLIINGTLEKTLTEMRTDTVTNGTSFFFVERNALWIFPASDTVLSYNHQKSPGLWRCPHWEAERMGKCNAAMQLAKKTVGVCVLQAVLALSLHRAWSWCRFSVLCGSSKCWKGVQFLTHSRARQAECKNHLFKHKAPAWRLLTLRSLEEIPLQFFMLLPPFYVLKVWALHNVAPAHELLVLKVVSSMCQALCGCRQLNTALSPGSRRFKDSVRRRDPFLWWKQTVLLCYLKV